MLHKRDGKIYMDGTPVEEIGALVARRGIVGAPQPPPQPKRVASQEFALCRRCRKEKPTTEFGGHLFRDARGYVGKCKYCEALEKQVEE